MDFDFTALSDIDYQALKRLFQQLFYTHAPQMDLGKLADHVVYMSQEHGTGTVVKVDDLEQVHDPYAVTSVVTLGEASPAAEVIQSYLVAQLSRAASAKPLLDLVKSASSTAPLTFVLSERMINLPCQIVVPMMRMLFAELEEGRNEVSPPARCPSHAIFFSRAFSADALEEGHDEDNNDDEPTGLAGARKRKAHGDHAHPSDAAAAALGKEVSNKRGTGASHDDGYGSFHPEDEFIMAVASHAYTFRFPAPRDAADTYEPPFFGRVLAVPYTKVPDLLSKLESAFPA